MKKRKKTQLRDLTSFIPFVNNAAIDPNIHTDIDSKKWGMCIIGFTEFPVEWMDADEFYERQKGKVRKWT